MTDPIAYSIGGLPPAATVETTDLIELERPSTVPGNAATPLHASIAQVLAMAGSGAQTGDMLVTARDPGAGWLRQDTVYSQSAYPALYALVGLLTDGPPGATYVTGSGALGRTVAMYATISDDEIIGVGDNIIWRSHDGGTTWASETVTLGNLVGVWALPSGIYAVTATAWYRSADGGATFSAITRPTGNPQAPGQMFESQGRVFAVIASSVAMQYSDNFGINWTSTGESGRISVMSFGNGVLISFANGNVATRRSTDNGTTWVTGTSLPSSGGGPTSSSTPYADGSGLGVVATNAGYITRTTDYGVTWSASLWTETLATIRHVLRIGGRLLAIVSGNYANAYSDDLGASWQRATGTSYSNPVVIIGKYAVVVTNATGAIPKVSSYQFGYDTGTQFKTPPMAGIGAGFKGYIKA